MLLRVEIDGEHYLVDAGFGLTPTAPLRFVPETVQATPHGSYRLLQTPRGFLLQAQLGEQWHPLYLFDLQPQEQRDYEVANGFVSTQQWLMAARAAPGCRYTLRNNEFTVRDAEGKAAERQRIRDAAELRCILQREFLLALPADRELEPALARIAAFDSAAPRAA
jgi:N-hydroxyarylamine O-acetyltransferase